MNEEVTTNVGYIAASDIEVGAHVLVRPEAGAPSFLTRVVCIRTVRKLDSLGLPFNALALDVEAGPRWQIEAMPYERIRIPA